MYALTAEDNPSIVTRVSVQACLRAPVADTGLGTEADLRALKRAEVTSTSRSSILQDIASVCPTMSPSSAWFCLTAIADRPPPIAATVWHSSPVCGVIDRTGVITKPPLPFAGGCWEKVASSFLFIPCLHCLFF